MVAIPTPDKVANSDATTLVMPNHVSIDLQSYGKHRHISALIFVALKSCADTAAEQNDPTCRRQQSPKEIPFTFAINTMYTVQMSYDVGKSEMKVGINRIA